MVHFLHSLVLCIGLYFVSAVKIALVFRSSSYRSFGRSVWSGVFLHGLYSFAFEVASREDMELQHNPCIPVWLDFVIDKGPLEDGCSTILASAVCDVGNYFLVSK